MEKVEKKAFSLWRKGPEDLPRKCREGGAAYQNPMSLSVGPGRLGRWLRHVAPWVSIVMVGLMAVTKLKFFELGGSGAAMALVAAVVVPAVLFHVAGSLMPTRVRLRCSKYGWSRFFKVRGSIDNRWSRGRID